MATSCIAQIACKSKFVVNSNSQKFCFISAFYIFVFYYKSIFLLFIGDPRNITSNLRDQLPNYWS